MTTTIPAPNLDAGEVYWVDLDPVAGTEQSGRRPVIVLSDQRLHRISLRALVCPITSNQRPWPTKIVIPPGCVVEGSILIDQARMIDRRARSMRYIGRLPDAVIDLAIETLIAFLRQDGVRTE